LYPCEPSSFHYSKPEVTKRKDQLVVGEALNCYEKIYDQHISLKIVALLQVQLEHGGVHL
jgi:hypothetical protein